MRFQEERFPFDQGPGAPGDRTDRPCDVPSRGPFQHHDNGLAHDDAVSPALLGGYIWDGNRSHSAIRESHGCVINVPTVDLADQVVAIGNSHAEQGSKFAGDGSPSWQSPTREGAARRRTLRQFRAPSLRRSHSGRVRLLHMGDRQATCGANGWTAHTPLSRPGILHGGGNGSRLSKALQAREVGRDLLSEIRCRFICWARKKCPGSLARVFNGWNVSDGRQRRASRL